MGRKAQRIESPENTTTNSYLRIGFWVQKQGIPFISIHLCFPLTCIPYNHLSVAMVHMKLSVVSRLSASALTITKNTDGHCYYSHSLCVLVHLLESGKCLCYSTHTILTTTKAAGTAITRWSTKSFKNFCLPVTKIQELLHHRQRVPQRALKWKKKKKSQTRAHNIKPKMCAKNHQLLNELIHLNAAENA